MERAAEAAKTQGMLGLIYNIGDDVAIGMQELNKWWAMAALPR